MFPEAKSRKDKRQLYKLVSATAEYSLRDHVVANPDLVGTTASVWVRASSDIDMYLKGNIDGTLDESQRRVSDLQLAWAAELQSKGRIRKNASTRNSSPAAILASLSKLVFWVRSPDQPFLCWSASCLSFPIGVLAAVYLEEFCQQRTDKPTYRS